MQLLNTTQTMRDIHIHSCGVWFGGGPVRLRTILGSCVAITLWHPRLRIGGLCHFMIAESSSPKRVERNGCYADSAMEMLEAGIAKAGVKPRDLEAKLFGGGQMFACPEPGAKWSMLNQVQERNIAVGRDLVRRYGHPIVAEHLGGQGHRSLVFDLTTGLAWLKHSPLGSAQTPERQLAA
ncbi:chemotaxis protein CheD [Imhoffiella purpurea]|uniref:Probable chemoreceptor glutamine deamidase CheD n=1 Tax=Imhoffiella purpurea TaxID=1249627 RepID=W9VGN4_9GAMM|nr:chemotaxis protein CheD [Imhoffiella purpurea]EXJ16171.1 Chemotaxis protein CheD [Imhoffiella purpurea]